MERVVTAIAKCKKLKSLTIRLSVSACLLGPALEEISAQWVAIYAILLGMSNTTFKQVLDFNLVLQGGTFTELYDFGLVFAWDPEAQWYVSRIDRVLTAFEQLGKVVLFAAIDEELQDTKGLARTEAVIRSYFPMTSRTGKLVVEL